MKNQVTTAVFPVAGLGTRFLPITKTGPKEMLPIVDKPLIQYVVQEAVNAGIKQLIFVTSNSKRALEDYFDRHFELERYLIEQNKTTALALIKSMVPDDVSIVYVRQPTPMGLGDAVLRARHVVGNEPFAVLLADDIIDCGLKNCLQNMIEIYQQTSASVLAVETIAAEETSQYGIVSLAEKLLNGYEINGIIEKPMPECAPSNLAVVGRYILTPRIFEMLSLTAQGVGGEIQLTDAIAALLTYEKVVAFPFHGKRYDCGSKLGFLEATVVHALQRPDLGEAFRNILKRLLTAHANDATTAMKIPVSEV
jgi:UTP--glucose-1-phosphate uridylyltransferase